MKFNRSLKQCGFLLLITLLTACSLLNAAPPTENQDDSTEQLEPPTQNQVDPASQDEFSDDGEILTCFHANNFVLNFDHTLTVNEGGASLTHILKQGGVALINDKESEAADSFITTVAPQTLDFEYIGVVGDCSVDAGGTVIVSAEGYCNDGIVYLTITEEWQGTTGSMTCDDTVMPFSAPGYTATHSGASGMGEEFLITDDPNGYTVMREFLGGDGYHSWTLLMDIDLTPLVPEP